jgi:hypothetical protein
MNNGFIRIGYFENGLLSTGNYIFIFNDGEFWVGEIFWNDGKRR